MVADVTPILREVLPENVNNLKSVVLRELLVLPLCQKHVEEIQRQAEPVVLTRVKQRVKQVVERVLVFCLQRDQALYLVENAPAIRVINQFKGRVNELP